jgi:hypothetical protein
VVFTFGGGVSGECVLSFGGSGGRVREFELSGPARKEKGGRGFSLDVL